MKILITGIVASGKTTLAKRLSKEFCIPWYELDGIVHPESDGRKRRSKDEQFKVISQIDQDGSWIFEGTNRESYRYLFDMADIIIFTDPPLLLRVHRIMTRYIKQKLGIEPSLYQPSLYMLGMMYKWTFNFEKNRRKFKSFLIQYQHKLTKVRNINKINWRQTLETRKSFT